MKVRGYLAIALVCVGLVLCDVVQRLVVAPWVWLRPGSRVFVLGRWQHFLAWFVLMAVSRVGGGRIPKPPARVPCGPGHLILMNHQSLFDIPLVVQSVDGGYPRIVTRERYSRFIPTISHMTRLYQYPVVDPSANKDELRKTLEELERTGRETGVPLVVFPEGARTRDGEIRKFRRGGLTRLLSARDWTVHLFVIDGFWKAARFGDLVGEIGRLEGKYVHAGTLQWTDPEADPDAFVEEARRLMLAALADLRGAASPA